MMLVGMYDPISGKIVNSWYCPITSQNPIEVDNDKNELKAKNPKATERTAKVDTGTGTLLDVDAVFVVDEVVVEVDDVGSMRIIPINVLKQVVTCRNNHLKIYISCVCL